MTPSLASSAATPTAFELSFVRPMFGLTRFTKFQLEQFDDTGALFTLTSLEAHGPQLFLARPGVFFPAYSPTLPAGTAQELGTDAPELLVTLTLGAGITEHCANLSAPIVWNPEAGTAVQVVLDDDQWTVRVPLISGA